MRVKIVKIYPRSPTMLATIAQVRQAARPGGPAAGSGSGKRDVAIASAAEGQLRARFQALGGPCEILIDAANTPAVVVMLSTIAEETWRIQDKFSRYQPGGIVHQINTANGAPVWLDEETVGLINYAMTCYHLSGGLFDITSGVLRKVWRFDGSNILPTAKKVRQTLARVGWEKVAWEAPRLQLQSGMEIDLGGIGKEYAVDRAALLLEQYGCTAALVNFGGDLRATGPRRDGKSWQIGIDDPHNTGQACVATQSIATGAMATSGDARRFIQARGQRYGHILNPRTGWPVRGAPRSVTVLAQTCLEAGMLATFGMLQGANAENFLRAQGVQHFIVW